MTIAETAQDRYRARQLARRITSIEETASASARGRQAAFSTMPVDLGEGTVEVPLPIAVGLGAGAGALAAQVAEDLAVAEEAVAQAVADVAVVAGEVTTLRDVTLPGLSTEVGQARDDVLAAQQAVADVVAGFETLEDDVDAAAQAASDANAAALSAAGLAASKGEVIYQASAPTGSRANPANLWIRTSDNRPATYNPDTATWVPVTDKVATDAATAAAGAQTTANTATTTANAKNRVIWSTSAASGTTSGGVAYRDGDVWFRKVTASGLITGQWEFLSGSWVARTLDSQVIASLDAGKITTGTLDAARIAALSITSAAIAADAIVAAKIAAGAVVTDKLAAEAVTAAKIAVGAIVAEKIAAGAITAEKIAAGAITASSLAADAITGKTITGGKIVGAEVEGVTITATSTLNAATLNVVNGVIRATQTTAAFAGVEAQSDYTLNGTPITRRTRYGVGNQEAWNSASAVVTSLMQAKNAQGQITQTGHLELVHGSQSGATGTSTGGLRIRTRPTLSGPMGEVEFFPDQNDGTKLNVRGISGLEATNVAASTVQGTSVYANTFVQMGLPGGPVELMYGMPTPLVYARFTSNQNFVSNATAQWQSYPIRRNFAQASGPTFYNVVPGVYMVKLLLRPMHDSGTVVVNVQKNNVTVTSFTAGVGAVVAGEVPVTITNGGDFITIATNSNFVGGTAANKYYDAAVSGVTVQYAGPLP